MNVATSASTGDETDFFVRSVNARPVSAGTVTQHEDMFALLQSSALSMCLQHSCSATFIEATGMAHNMVGVRTSSTATNAVKIRHGKTRLETRRVSRGHSVLRVMPDILQPVCNGRRSMFSPVLLIANPPGRIVLAKKLSGGTLTIERRWRRKHEGGNLPPLWFT